MKDKKIIPLIALLAAAVIAVAAVIIFSARAGKNGGGEESTTAELTTPEPTTPEPTKPQIVYPDPYVQEGEAYVIDENNQILYGWYPCTLMEAGISGLEVSEYDQNGITEIDGTRYMRIAKGEGYDYYRFEMIKWDIIADTGSEYILISSKVLDSMPYNTAFVETSWDKSSLCTWLNGYFYETAFSDKEKEGIADTEVIPDSHPIFGTVTAENITVKVYLFSLTETVRADFGFIADVQKEDAARVCVMTPFAEARGCIGRLDGSCKWWTRTNGRDTTYAVYISENGIPGIEGNFVNSAGIGVRPVINVSKSALKQPEEQTEEPENNPQ